MMVTTMITIIIFFSIFTDRRKVYQPNANKTWANNIQITLNCDAFITISSSNVLAQFSYKVWLTIHRPFYVYGEIILNDVKRG